MADGFPGMCDPGILPMFTWTDRSLRLMGVISCFLKLFIYLWLYWVFAAVCGLSLVATSWVRGTTLPWGVQVSHCSGFSCCRAQALGCVGFSSRSPPAQSWWSMGSIPPQQVGSSQTKDQTRIPCFGRQILNRWTTREVADFTSLNLS